MTAALYWFGLAHAIAYAAGGALLIISFIINRMIRRVGLMGELRQAYFEVLKRRRADKERIVG